MSQNYLQRLNAKERKYLPLFFLKIEKKKKKKNSSKKIITYFSISGAHRTNSWVQNLNCGFLISSIKVINNPHGCGRLTISLSRRTLYICRKKKKKKKKREEEMKKEKIKLPKFFVWFNFSKTTKTFQYSYISNNSNPGCRWEKDDNSSYQLSYSAF